MQHVCVDEVMDMLRTEKWKDLPFLHKEDLRRREYHIVENNHVLHWFSSSGSTAEPVIYPWTVHDEVVACRSLAAVHDLSEKRSQGVGLVIAPTGMPGMWFHMDRQLRYLGLATAFPDVKSADSVLGLIETLSPKVLASLPFIMSRLGELYRLRHPEMSYRPEAIICAGDVLSAARRKKISELWECPVRNFYGLSEIYGPLACDADADGLALCWQDWHTPEVFIEVLDPLTKQPIEPGGTGIAVATTLWDRPASLVRYWTGDIFELQGWLEPGRPRFRICGREAFRLPGAVDGVYPVDLDEVLLSYPAAGNEWGITLQGDEVRITLEANDLEAGVTKDLAEAVQAMFLLHTKVELTAPGSLPRKQVKLGAGFPQFQR